MPIAPTAVRTDSPRKNFPGSAGPALAGVDHGLLGPNGAGKTSPSPTPPTARWGATPAACAAGSTWPPA
ncbi:hypothetical protein [Pseudonocardia sp. GCM10023141]|uniref:hypothetical protein n=1 Tax=Pseudonocardia sp. GCM10023141 TaxID=3252653 RepID=UPI00361E6582